MVFISVQRFKTHILPTLLVLLLGSQLEWTKVQCFIQFRVSDSCLSIVWIHTATEAICSIHKNKKCDLSINIFCLMTLRKIIPCWNGGNRCFTLKKKYRIKMCEDDMWCEPFRSYNKLKSGKNSKCCHVLTRLMDIDVTFKLCQRSVIIKPCQTVWYLLSVIGVWCYINVKEDKSSILEGDVQSLLGLIPV